MDTEPHLDYIKPVVYTIFNISVGCGIVFANKAVLSVYNFKFVYALTLVHTVVTMFGMWLFAAGKIFEVKRFRAVEVRACPVPAQPTSAKQECWVHSVDGWCKSECLL